MAEVGTLTLGVVTIDAGEFAQWMIRRVWAKDYGCFTGDCPHHGSDECGRAMVAHFIEESNDERS